MAKLTGAVQGTERKRLAEKVTRLLNCHSIDQGNIGVVYYYKLPKNHCLAEIKDYVRVIIKYV